MLSLLPLLAMNNIACPIECSVCSHQHYVAHEKLWRLEWVTCTEKSKDSTPPPAIRLHFKLLHLPHPPFSYKFCGNPILTHGADAILSPIPLSLLVALSCQKSKRIRVPKFSMTALLCLLACILSLMSFQNWHECVCGLNASSLWLLL